MKETNDIIKIKLSNIDEKNTEATRNIYHNVIEKYEKDNNYLMFPFFYKDELKEIIRNESKIFLTLTNNLLLILFVKIYFK